MITLEINDSQSKVKLRFISVYRKLRVYVERFAFAQEKYSAKYFVGLLVIWV